MSLKNSIIFIVLVLTTISCDPDYWEGDTEYNYMSEIGWKNENMNIETSFKMVNSRNTQYFNWYRNDSLIMEGYIQEFIDKYAEQHETYALVLLSNGYYTQFKKVELDNNNVVLDTKWPQKTIDSLSLYEYERLEWY